MDQLRTACVGAGPVGRAWTLAFARSGKRVALFDTDEGAIDAALRWIRQAAGAGADDILARVNVARTLEAAMEGAAYVQESVVEDEAVKRAIFAAMDAACEPAAIIASSTSEIVGSRFQEGLAGRGRCLVAHPLNPPHLVPLVELCPTPWTTKASVEAARRFLTSVGQRPITLNKEVRGFVANRLQVAVIAEALHLVEEGVCSVEDVDTAMKHGLALRWLVTGPFETGHLNADGGYQEYLRKYGPALHAIASDLGGDRPWSDDLITTVDAACRRATVGASVPARQAWRDRRLAEVRTRLNGMVVE
jgi:3-hydroxyacyl-CoA dehydrogenase